MAAALWIIITRTIWWDIQKGPCCSAELNLLTWRGLSLSQAAHRRWERERTPWAIGHPTSDPRTQSTASSRGPGLCSYFGQTPTEATRGVGGNACTGFQLAAMRFLPCRVPSSPSSHVSRPLEACRHDKLGTTILGPLVQVAADLTPHALGTTKNCCPAVQRLHECSGQGAP